MAEGDPPQTPISGGLHLILSPAITSLPGHYLISDEADDSCFEGRPPGFWWDAPILNIDRAPGPEAVLLASSFTVRG